MAGPCISGCELPFEIKVNWLGDVSEEHVREQFSRLRNGKTEVKQSLRTDSSSLLGATRRIRWISPIISNGLNLLKTKRHPSSKNSHQVATASKVRPPTKRVRHLRRGQPQRDRFQNYGESSRAGLHFAGECLDIDGITGGYNFQVLGQVEDWQARHGKQTRVRIYTAYIIIIQTSNS